MDRHKYLDKKFNQERTKLEKKRLEKERLEKERLEKERLEKERLNETKDRQWILHFYENKDEIKDKIMDILENYIPKDVIKYEIFSFFKQATTYTVTIFGFETDLSCHWSY
jgi:hypothetical protein